MIELRWVVSDRNDTEPVLQYRTIGKNSFYGTDSDWKTVPTVVLKGDDNE